MPLCALGTPEPPGSAQRLHARGAHVHASPTVQGLQAPAHSYCISREVSPVYCGSQVLPGLEHVWPHCHYHCRGSPAALVRISAPALMLKRPSACRSV